jgi:hypothetical protein
MIRRFRPASSVLFTILALVIALTTLCASVTVAQEEGPATTLAPAAGMPLVAPAAPVPGGPGFFSQTALAFRPYPNQTVPFTYSSGMRLSNPDTVGHNYEAVVSLPQGVSVTKFVVWYLDLSASLDMSAALVRAPLDATLGSAMASVQSFGDSTANRYEEDTTITNPTVDMQSYTYWVETYLPPGSAAGILSFRIDYAYPSYLPLATK